MITNWDIISRLDSSTQSLLYTLVIDGTEADARLLAKKLQGYTSEPHPTNPPFVHALELASDLDEDTLERIRTATREGIAQVNKVNQFIPGGGILGDPLFHATEETQDTSFETVEDETDSFFKSSNTQKTEENEPITQLEKQSVKIEESDQLNLPPIPTVNIPHTLAPVSGEPDPVTERPPIDEQDMLIKDMEDSFLRKAPQVEDIFAAETKYDMFMDAEADALQSQKKKDEKIDNLADGKPSLEDTFNVFEQKIKDQTSIIDLEELTAITDRLSNKDMGFVKHANTSPSLAAEIQAAAKEQEKTMRLNNPSAPDAKEAFSPADAILNADLPEVPAVRHIEPAQQPQEGSLMENNNRPDLPEEVNLSNTVPPTSSFAEQKKSAAKIDDLPEITIRMQQPEQEEADESLEKTFNLTTTLNEEVMRSQYQKSFHNPQDPKPLHHIKPTVAAETHPTIRLKKRPEEPVAPAPKAPQAPSAAAENTTLHLRRKIAPQPSTPKPPVAPGGPAKANTPVAPQAQTVFEKTTTIDHSIELPLGEIKKHNWPLEVPLLPTYTLENMVMSVNRFAHATAISVIDNPGKLYNPLVLHGPTGTGKTHFLNALAYAFSKKFGQENIFMTNGVRLSRGIQRYVMEGNIEKFEKFMDTVKVLLIDDIHLLAINEQNRKQISVLLTKFLREQKQIVITSKYPPESLAKLEELIRFRLDSGWISELKPAGGSTHLKIVKKMLLDNGVDLSEAQITNFFGGSRMTLSTIMRNIHRLKVLENLIFPNLTASQRSQAVIFDKLLATTGEDPESQIVKRSPRDITSITTVGKGEWGRIGFFYPQNNSNMMNWMVYALQQRAKELHIPGGFEIAVRSSYATENIISSAFKIANLCDNKKLKGAVILGPDLDTCDPSVRENFYDILTHMLEIMLIRCGIINAEEVQEPSTYVKIISELLR